MQVNLRALRFLFFFSRVARENASRVCYFISIFPAYVYIRRALRRKHARWISRPCSCMKEASLFLPVRFLSCLSRMGNHFLVCACNLIMWIAGTASAGYTAKQDVPLFRATPRFDARQRRTSIRFPVIFSICSGAWARGNSWKTLKFVISREIV